MKKMFHLLFTIILSFIAVLFFSSCQHEQSDELSVTLKKDELSKNYTYWYKVSGTITMTAKDSAENSYETAISDGNLYVSWTETPNVNSNYIDYTLDLEFYFFEKVSNKNQLRSIKKNVYGTGGKYNFFESYSIDGDVKGDSFSYTIKYPDFYVYYPSSPSYKTEHFDAEIKLACKKV